MIFTNIPWTQVVLAICAIMGMVITMLAVFHRLATADLKRDIHLILTNHLPHMNAKINMILDHLNIPHPKD